MKNIFSYLGWMLIITVAFTALLWVIIPRDGTQAGSVSPIPSFLTLSENDQVRFLDLWAPFVQQTFGDTNDAPQISARSALVYDLTTDKVIYEKDPDKRLPMASLTKIMTAIVSLENPRDDDRYLVTDQNLVGEDSMGLSAGEILTQKELLYGLMLPSGNDAAEVIASNYQDGRESFLQVMNDKAKALGLLNTRFSNPSGLQGDGIQYTTAYDLLVMTRYALQTYPLFAEIVRQPEHELVETDTHKAFYLENETNLLTTYEGIKGVKTGYTPEAGLCLVTYIDYGGHQMVAILLKSEDRRGEMLALLDYSLKQVGVEPPEYTGE